MSDTRPRSQTETTPSEAGSGEQRTLPDEIERRIDEIVEVLNRSSIPVDELSYKALTQMAYDLRTVFNFETFPPLEWTMEDSPVH